MMTSIPRRKLVFGLPALTLAGALRPAAAQTQGTVRMVVGFPPGGGADRATRLIAEKLAPELGTTVIVDNRPGAGGTIAADYVRGAPADGLTIFTGGTHTMVVAPLTLKTVRYLPMRDFKPLGITNRSWLGLAVPASGPPTLDAWLRASRAQPQKAACGIPAVGSLPELILIQLGTEVGVPFVMVPYRGAAPLVTDLVGGQVPAALTSIQDYVAHHRDGRIRVLAVTGDSRAAPLPDVPTFKESGIKGFERLDWGGPFVRADTPEPIAERLERAFAKVLTLPEIVKALTEMGVLPAYSDAAAARRLVESDTAHWSAVIKASGYVPQ